MRIALAFAAALVAAATLAADLGKYNDWASSPLAYFMTAGDRTAWAAVTNEAEAATFVKAFVAKRGRDFEERVADRAQAADEHFTIGKKAGSKTLRGKLIIVLGPPAKLAIKELKVTQRETNLGHNLGRVGKTTDFYNPPIGTTPMTVKHVFDYTFSYPNVQPFVVQVNAESGEERILDAKTARRVDELLQRAVDARAAEMKTAH